MVENDVDGRDLEWVDRITTGDYDAFDAMVGAYAAPLCAYATNWVEGSLEPQDLVQDLFFWIWEHRGGWSVPGSLKAYLYRAVRNRAISHLRRRRVEQRFRDETTRDRNSRPDRGASAASGADQALHVSELGALVSQTIDALPERCRHVFVLNRQHQLTYVQIADALQISVKTVEMHMARALSRLRERLADWI